MSFLRISSDPLDDMLRLQRALTRSLTHPFFGSERAPADRGVFPGLNVFEADDGAAIVVKSEMPGIDKDKVTIEIEGNRLSVEGSREIQSADEGARYHRRERSSGTFRRTFKLPFAVDRESATASYDKGVLTVRLEKAAAAKPHQIALKS